MRLRHGIREGVRARCPQAGGAEVNDWWERPRSQPRGRMMALLALTFALLGGVVAHDLLAQPRGEPVTPTPAAEGRKMIGTNAVIVGTVAEVYRTEKVTRLNFEQKFPKQVFTAVVFPRNYGMFTNLDTLAGKRVEVSGRVTEYRGQPQMILNTRGQLRVLPAP